MEAELKLVGGYYMTPVGIKHEDFNMPLTKPVQILKRMLQSTQGAFQPSLM